MTQGHFVGNPCAEKGVSDQWLVGVFHALVSCSDFLCSPASPETPASHRKTLAAPALPVRARRHSYWHSSCFRPSDRLAGWDSHPLEIADLHGVLGCDNADGRPMSHVMEQAGSTPADDKLLDTCGNRTSVHQPRSYARIL